MKRLFNYSFFIAGTMLFSALKANAQEPMNLSLEECIKYALKNNISIKNAQIDVLIAQAQNSQTLATALPKISGKAELDDYVKPPVTFFPNSAINLINPTAGLPNDGFQQVSFTPKYNGTATINASQPLFDGTLLIAYKAQKSVIELVRQSGKLTEEGVRYNVERAYYSLVIAQRQLAIADSSLAAAKAIERDNQIQRQAGFAEKLDVDRATVQVNNLETSKYRVSNLLEVSEQVLKYQMGMDIHQPIVLSDTSLQDALNEATAMINEDLNYEQRTDYNQLLIQQKVNGYNLQRYKFSSYPTLQAVANLGYNYASDKFSDLGVSNNYVFSSLIGVQLNVPIFNGFLHSNQIKEARLDIEKTKNSIDNLKQTIDFQTAQARSTLKNTLLQKESQERNQALANTVLDLARKKYQAGVGSSLEVNQAQNDLLQSQNNYFQSLLDVINAQTDLQKALGQFK